MVSASYKYKIDIILILKNENIYIQNESIVAITIDSNYDTSNRPILYVTFNIQSRIYDKLVLNKDNNSAVINLRIRKSSKGTTSISKDYIHDNFIYLMKSDPDYYRGLKDKFRLTDKNDEDSYVFGTIALFRKDSLDNIKNVYNDIVRNSNMASIIHRYTYDRKMVIEPLQSTKDIDCILIPPMESLTELIEFLNKYDALYDRKYRYFEDFGVTYLLSASGKPVHSTDTYDTIIINIVEPTDERSKNPGINIDNDNSAYVLYVDAQDTTIDINTAKNIEYDNIIGISSSGELYKVPLHNNSNGHKSLLQRIYNDNTRFIDNIKHELDSTSIIVQLNKSEVDGSLFTPNKEYLINNYKDLTEYNGKVIIAFKKEVIVQQDGDFTSSIIIGLRKVME